MRRQAVDSDTIASIGYDPRRCELEVEFRDSGDVYRYFGVSAEEHDEFISSESKGGYLNRVFKAKSHCFFVMKQGRK